MLLKLATRQHTFSNRWRKKHMSQHFIKQYHCMVCLLCCSRSVCQIRTVKTAHVWLNSWIRLWTGGHSVHYWIWNIVLAKNVLLNGIYYKMSTVVNMMHSAIVYHIYDSDYLWELIQNNIVGTELSQRKSFRWLDSWEAIRKSPSWESHSSIWPISRLCMAYN